MQPCLNILYWAKLSKRGLTILINSVADTVLINKQALCGVTMRLICEKPLSHSDEEIGVVLREMLMAVILLGINFSTTYSQNPQIICLSFSCSILDIFLIYFSTNVK
jgi:hypothetical protein